MKKTFLYLTLSITILLHPSLTICSEKNWLQNKLDAFSHKMVTRHTYEHNSFEHIRDRAFLFMLPASTAQGILMLQRSNMKKFLKKNEENALEEIKSEFDFSNQEWAEILDTIEKEKACSMKTLRDPKNNYRAIHDQSLPKEWVEDLKYECRRHKIIPENINFGIIADNNDLARAFTQQDLFSNKYNNQINLNLVRTAKKPKGIFKYISAHEMVHIAEQHSLSTHVVLGAIRTKSQQQKDLMLDYILSGKPIRNICLFFYLNPFIAIQQFKADAASFNDTFDRELKPSPSWQSYRAAKEKTADTLVACSDSAYADNYANLLKIGATSNIYSDNHNDVIVLNSNWQTSQAITNFQQLKSSIKQKLAAFPKFVA